MKQINDTLYDILDSNTGEYFTYNKVTTYADGTAMTDEKCDGVIYRKKGAEYFKRNFTGPVNVKWFGAKGDGVTDDTAAIQKALDSSVNNWLTGENTEFLVSTLLLNSDQNLKDIKLKLIPNAPVFSSPITIYGIPDLRKSIRLVNVHVHGNRSNQDNIIDNLGEDGGYNGFRIIGDCRDIELKNCSATYCGTDGLELFSKEAAYGRTDDPETLCFQNITVTNCVFEWNRRHGVSLDSARNIKFIGGRAKHNGKDLDTVSPLSSGIRGHRTNGNLYGRPFDIEGYGIGTGIDGLTISKCDLTQNIGGLLFFDSAIPTDPGFLTRKNIYLSDLIIDRGENPIYPPILMSTVYVSDQTPLYENVNIANCGIYGQPNFFNVKNLSITGGFLYSDTNFKVLLERCTQYSVSSASNKPLISVDVPPVDIIITPGFGPVFNITSEILKLIDSDSVQLNIKGSAAAAGNLSIALTFSETDFYIKKCNCSAIDLNSGIAVLCSSKIRYGDDHIIFVSLSPISTTDTEIELFIDFSKK